MNRLSAEDLAWIRARAKSNDGYCAADDREALLEELDAMRIGLAALVKLWSDTYGSSGTPASRRVADACVNDLLSVMECRR